MADDLTALHAELVRYADEAARLWVRMKEPVYAGPSGKAKLTTAMRKKAEAAEREYFMARERRLRHAMMRVNQMFVPFLNRYVVLADRVVKAIEAVRPGWFPTSELPPDDVSELKVGRWIVQLFGTGDQVEAGKRFLLWCSWFEPNNAYQPDEYRDLFALWVHPLLSTDDLMAFVRAEPWQWAVRAFEQFRSTLDPNKPANAGTKQSEVNDDAPEFAPQQEPILKALWELGAVSRETCKTREEVANHLKAPGQAANLGAKFAELERRRFIGTRPGPGGGCWLTESGQSARLSK